MTLDEDKKGQGRGVDNHGYLKGSVSGSDRSMSSFKDKHQIGDKLTSKAISEKENNSNDDKVDETVDISCGVWKFRTNALGTKFANLYVFTVCVGISMLFTQMVHSVIHVQLVSIERQFKLDNAQAGLFDTASKAGHLTTILLAGHFAKKVHIPVVIGLSGMFQGIILMIPAFMQMANPYTLPLLSGSGSGNDTNSSVYGDNEKYLCYSTNNGSTQNARSEATVSDQNLNNPSDAYNHMAFVTILIVQAVKGITDTFHSGFLPTLYVDDNMLDKSRIGIFFGIKYVIGELASPVGKQVNAILTEVPIDLKKTDMDTKDQRFIAAWWLAFLIFGAATTVFSFPIILFPRRLVSSRQQDEALQKAMVSLASPSAGDEKKEINNKKKTSDALRKPSITVIGIKETVKPKRSFTPRSSVNRGSVYSHGSSRKSSLFPPVNGPSERKVSVDGNMAFDQPIRDKQVRQNGGQPRSEFMELIKDFPHALARVFKRPVFLLILVDIAIVSIPLSGTSIFRSIYITSEYNVRMTEVATLQAVTSAVTNVIGTLVSGWLSSKVKSKMGYMWIIFATYIITIGIMPMYMIFGCGNEQIYGHDGDFGQPANVAEACGCNITRQLISCGTDGNNYLTPCHAGCLSSVGKTFTNCSGLAELALNQSMTLVPGLCATKCKTNFYLYVCLHAIQGMFSSMASIPRRLLILRIVDPRDRAFATSLFAFFGTILSIPSPNLFGRIIDDTCLVKDGSVCSLYDRDKIRYLMSGIDIGVHGCVQITFVLMFCVFKWEERKMKRKMEKEQGTDKGDTELQAKI